MYKNREGYRPIELCWSSRVLLRLRCEPIESMICALLLLGCRCRCCWSAVLQRCQRCTLFLSHTLRVVVVLGAIRFSFPVEHTSNWHWLDRFQLFFLILTRHVSLFGFPHSFAQNKNNKPFTLLLFTNFKTKLFKTIYVYRFQHKHTLLRKRLLFD